MYEEATSAFQQVTVKLIFWDTLFADHLSKYYQFLVQYVVKARCPGVIYTDIGGRKALFLYRKSALSANKKVS
jgi:hypothetical protein